MGQLPQQQQQHQQSFWSAEKKGDGNEHLNWQHLVQFLLKTNIIEIVKNCV